MRKPPTHFEQIPVEDVKKIADKDAPKADAPKDEDTRPGNLIVEPSSRKTEPYSVPASMLHTSEY